MGFSGGSMGKESTCNAGDTGSNLGPGRSPEGRRGSPLQCSCLENPMDREAWQLQSMGSQRVGHDWRYWTCVHTRMSQEYCLNSCPQSASHLSYMACNGVHVIEELNFKFYFLLMNLNLIMKLNSIIGKLWRKELPSLLFFSPFFDPPVPTWLSFFFLSEEPHIFIHYRPILRDSSRPGFLNISTIDIWKPDSSLLWGVLCTIGCWRVPLTSTHYIPVASPPTHSCANQKISPNVPHGAELHLIENHWDRYWPSIDRSGWQEVDTGLRRGEIVLKISRFSLAMTLISKFFSTVRLI